jgi:FAD/FMN-containing dehydrogenase/Fe-S oxidoreductase
MIDSSRLNDCLSTLSKRVVGELRHDDLTRALFSTDASLYQAMPLAVLQPRTVEDVQAAVAIASEFQVPLLARAAGTSLAGQAVNEALIIDVSRHLDGLIEVNPEAGWARVQPGMILDDLNRALRSYGLQFGPDPASSNRSTVGGAVANNATGSHSIVYGMSADHVLAMQVVLRDGSIANFALGNVYQGVAAEIAQGIEALVNDPANRQIIRDHTPRHWRRCGGYNLDRLTDDRPLNLAALVCGSEGTLGIMTEITVNLVPVPAYSCLALLDFDDLYLALEAVPGILATGPSAVELLDDLSMTMCYEIPEYARLIASVIPGKPHSLLVVEYSGESCGVVRDGIDRLQRYVKTGRSGAGRVTLALSPAQQAAVWSVRKVGLGLLMSIKGDMKPLPFIEDAAVPVESLPAYVRGIEDYCRGLGTPISYYAHASAGCLHIRPLINTRSAAELAKMPDIARFSAELVKSFGGALSSEHGDGRTRSWLNESFFGPDLYGLYRRVKQIFDPQGLFNPGVIVDPQPMTEFLRLAPVDNQMSRLDFSDYAAVDITPHRPPANDPPPVTGLVRAIEMCNGAGVCLQRASGTMCPSFMVTREERHSTRGRANALRATMTGLLPPAELTSARMYEVMDLCIACKACKAECPSAVDMARIKLEFLARYHEVNGVPWRSRVFGHIATIDRLASGPLSRVANRMTQSDVFRRAIAIAPERKLPPLTATTFERWWQRRRVKGPVASGRPAGRLVLLVDTFTNYNYPEIGIAAVEFLEAAGWDVVVPPFQDEGRALISKGLHRSAKKAAEKLVERLAPLAQNGLPIVGLEPSSLLTLRDEYHYLLPDDSRVPIIAAQALTFEEFVAHHADRIQATVAFSGEPRRLLLHGHCHQKALVGTAPARRALALPPGYEVEEVDSGCCGMAGSFGYEAEHYDLSLRMAERRLLPAVRAAAAEMIIVAAGVSCRQQIEHGSGRRALHPAQVLRDALADYDRSPER